MSELGLEFGDNGLSEQARSIKRNAIFWASGLVISSATATEGFVHHSNELKVLGIASVLGCISQVARSVNSSLQAGQERPLISEPIQSSTVFDQARE
jgi:hypothetical protein